MRKHYQQHGVQGYYTAHGSTYRNPHDQQLRRALYAGLDSFAAVCDSAPIRILDLACGSGEATMGCIAWAKERPLDITAADPFTFEAYEARVGQAAEQFSFEDVEAGILQDRSFDLCICSFAMHLVPPSRLYLVLFQLAMSCRYLLLLSPHKKPIIQENTGWSLRLIETHQRVHVRLFMSNAVTVVESRDFP